MFITHRAVPRTFSDSDGVNILIFIYFSGALSLLALGGDAAKSRAVSLLLDLSGQVSLDVRVDFIEF